ADRFEEEHGVDLREDDVALQRLKEEAENAKCELSNRDSVELSLPFIHSTDDGPIHLEEELERETYEELVDDLVEQTEGPCQQALDDAGLTADDIDTILLVGGMTRTPLVERRVADFFDAEPESTVNPDEVVASGAALQAAIARGELQEVLLLDVTPLTLGIETKGGQFEPIIERNTTIPCSESKTFTTARDNQEMVRVHVAQGERSRVEDNKSLATFELTGIPPAPRGVPEIEVTFEIDENGMVDVTARDVARDEKKTVNVIADGGLSDDQIEEMIEEAEKHAEEDERIRERNDLQNEAEGLLYSTERTLQSYGHELPEEERVEIEEDIETIKSLVDDASIEELETMIESLEAAAHRLADVMYDNTEGAPEAGEPEESSPGQSAPAE
ncbi:MAG: Hsp70 family protein, partial [Bradymonadaceae bacterium]